MNPSLRVLVVASRPLIGYYDVEELHGEWLVTPTDHYDIGQALPIPPLTREREISAIQDALSSGNCPATIRFLPDGTAGQLRLALNEGYTILHIDAHATSEYLFLERPTGEAHFVGTETLAELLGRTGVQLVILSACESEQIVGQLYHPRGPAIIGMSRHVSHETAATFTEGLFAQIGLGRTLSDAFEYALTAIRTDFLLAEEASIPVMMPSGSNLVLFSGDRSGAPQLEEASATRHNLPAFAVGDVFVGRDEIQVEVNRALCECQMVVLVGPPGAGKTTLACRTAQWHLDRQRYEAIVFYTTENSASVEGLLAAIDSVTGERFQEMFATPTGFSSEDVQVAAQAYLRDHAVLIVLDNFETVLQAAGGDISSGLISQGAARQLVAFLDQVRGESRILMTTREQPNCFDIQHPILVKGLERQSIGGRRLNPALDMFLFYADRDVTGTSGHELARIDTINDFLGNLPLAIKITASLIRYPSVLSIDDMLEELQQRTGHRLALDGWAPGPDRLRDYHLSLEISYCYLSSEAGKVLAVISIFRSSFDAASLTAVLDMEQPAWELLMEEVARHCLVDKQEEPERWHLLPVIRSFATSKLVVDTSLDMKALHSRAADHLLHRSPQLDLRSYRDYVEAHYHLVEADRHQEALALVAEVTGDMLRWGHWSELQQMLLRSEETARTLDDMALLVSALRDLGTIAASLGDYTRADGYWQEGLAISERQGELGNVCDMLNRLGVSADKRGSLERAEELWKRALDVATEINDSQTLIGLMANLASLEYRREDYVRAGDYYERGISLARAIDDHQKLCMLLAQCSGLKVALRQFSEVEQLIDEGLRLARRASYRQPQAILLANRGSLNSHLHNYTQATTDLHESLAIARDLGDPWLVVALHHSLGELHSELEEHDQAKRWFRQCLEMSEESEIRQYESMAVFGLAKITLVDGDTTLAQSLGQRSLRIWEEMDASERAEEVREWLARNCPMGCYDPS